MLVSLGVSKMTPLAGSVDWHCHALFFILALESVYFFLKFHAGLIFTNPLSFFTHFILRLLAFLCGLLNPLSLLFFQLSLILCIRFVKKLINHDGSSTNYPLLNHFFSLL